MATEQEIIDEIVSHIQDRGGSYSEWYVGIASDPKDRLFVGHNVSEKNDYWFFKKAQNDTNARNVEKYIIDTYGTDGAPGGGDSATVYVYSYKKSSKTDP